MSSGKFTLDDNLERLPAAFEYGLLVDSSDGSMALDTLRHTSCIAVGSGASFSASFYLAKLLEEFFLIPCKAETPYEYYSTSNPSAGVVLVSAAGKNQDILAALDRALVNDVSTLVIFTSKKESRLLENAKGFPKLHTVITGSLRQDEKEGFFGVQSLVAALGAFISMVPALRCQIKVAPRAWCAETCSAVQDYLEENKLIVERIAAADHVVGLATGWAMPSLIDFESKFVEGGLGWVEIAEGKNFTHGRFVNSWRRKSGTAIVLLATTDNREFLNSFREAYQTTFPILPILSMNPGALGGLELFLFVFYLFRILGKLRNVNTSSPEIPSEARTMFRGGSLYKGLALREKLNRDIEVIVELKRSLLRTSNTREEEIERTVPRPVVAASFTDLFSSKFAGLVCDYDGTLVSLDKRDDPLDRELVLQLERLLREEIRIAIITGRGGSAFESLQFSIDPSLHHLVYCYLNNGGLLKRLDGDEPLKLQKLEGIELIERRLNESTELQSCMTRLKIAKYSSQITANLERPEQADLALRLINASLVDFQSVIQVRTSGGSVDIFPRGVSKRSACDDFKDRLGTCSQNSVVLIIGDSGQENGNDFELLQQRFSLSVDRLHWVPSTCFPVLDLEGASIRGPAATLDALNRAVVSKPTFALREKNA